MHVPMLSAETRYCAQRLSELRKGCCCDTSGQQSEITAVRASWLQHTHAHSPPLRIPLTAKLLSCAHHIIVDSRGMAETAVVSSVLYRQSFVGGFNVFAFCSFLQNVSVSSAFFHY